MRLTFSNNWLELTKTAVLRLKFGGYLESLERCISFGVSDFGSSA